MLYQESFTGSNLLTKSFIISYNLTKELRELSIIPKSVEMVLHPPLAGIGRFSATIYEAVGSRNSLVHGFGLFSFSDYFRCNLVKICPPSAHHLLRS